MYVHQSIIYVRMCMCSTDNDTTPLQLRLVGGTNEQQGRLEILYYGVWGYVCGWSFSFNSANVACRRLGFPGALSMVSRHPLAVSVPLWLSEVWCIGNETGLEQCPHRGFGNFGSFCNQYDDVGVVCIGMFVLLINVNSYILY